MPCGHSADHDTAPTALCPHGIVCLKHMAVFTYDNEISLPVSMENVPLAGYQKVMHPLGTSRWSTTPTNAHC